MLRRVAITLATLFGILIGLPALAILFLVLFYTWNDARPLIGSLVSGVLGREFRIDGDLDVDVGWITRVRVRDLWIANAEWGTTDKMLHVGALDFSLAIKPLFSGDIFVPQVAVNDLDTMLETNIKGVANWDFGDPDAKPAPSRHDTNLPLFANVDLKDAMIVYKDHLRNKETKVRLDFLNAGEDRAKQRISVRGGGQYQGRPMRLVAELGTIELLQDTNKPYPVSLNVDAGDLGADISGTITDPGRLKGVNLKVDVRGDDLSNLYPLIGIPIPPTPPYHLQGRLTHANTKWIFENFAGTLGTSDMRGTVAVDTGGQRLKLVGDVVSKRLDFKDLTGFIGASEGGDAPAVNEFNDNDGRVLPDKPVDLVKLREIDADIKFKGTRIVTPQLPIDRLDAALTLDNGTLRIQPASFDIGKGSVKVYFTLYGGEVPVRSDIEAVVRRVDIARFVKGQPMLEKTAGEFNGRVKMTSTGTSVAGILGSANGEMMLVLSEGQFSQLLVELMGLDIAESLGFLVEGDKPVPVRCIVADFVARNGIFEPRTLLFDTTDTKVVGSGTINMQTESLDLRIKPYPKDFSPLTLRTAISVQGTFANPQAFPDPADIGVDNTLKKVLNGVLTVVTGLLPPIDTGGGEDAPCQDLINQARQRVRAER